jgi:hypothetical protein
MSKLKFCLLMLMTTSILMGCLAGARGPVRAAIQIADGGISASDKVTYTKQGEATCVSILGWFGFGDCTIKTAAANAGVDEITNVDSKTVSILGMYASYTTVVYGK